MPTLSRNISLAINTGSFWPVTLEKSIDCLQELGLSDIELTLEPRDFSLTFHRELHMPCYSNLMAMVKSGDLKVHSLHAPHMTTEHGYSLRVRAEYLAYTLSICQHLKGRVVVVHPFHVFRSYEHTIGYLRGNLPDVWNALLPDTKTLLEQARAANIVIAMENVKTWADDDTDFFNAPANMKQFIDEVAHPNLGVTLDIFHAQLINYLHEFLERLADSIVNLHIADLNPPAQRVAPGEGTLVWDDLIPRLKSLPKVQQITIELARTKPDEVVRAVSFMSQCWNEF